MTSRNMQRTRLFAVILVIIATCLSSLAQKTVNDDIVKPNNTDIKILLNDKHGEKKPIIENTNSNVAVPNDNNNTKIVNGHNNNSNKDGTNNITSNEKTPVKVNEKIDNNEHLPTNTEPGINHTNTLNTGALRRGFYVFVGLSVLALSYMVFRGMRLNKSRPQMVRKYGVLAHKQDIEMRPLPLDEDDEDDTTVFDVSGLSSQHQHQQHQSSRS